MRCTLRSCSSRQGAHRPRTRRCASASALAGAAPKCARLRARRNRGESRCRAAPRRSARIAPSSGRDGQVASLESLADRDPSHSSAVPCRRRSRLYRSSSCIDSIISPGTILAEWERVVAAERDAVRAHQLQHVAQQVRIVDQRIDVEAAEVFARVGAGCRRRPGPGARGSRARCGRASRERRRRRGRRRRAGAAASRTRRRRSCSRSRARFPRACRPATAASSATCAPGPACPRDARRPRRRAPARPSKTAKHARIVEIASVDVRADLDARELRARARSARARGSRAPAPASAPCRARRSASGARSTEARDVIVEEAAQVERVLGLRPVAEHHRHGREHLHVDAGARAILEALVGIPAVGLDRRGRACLPGPCARSRARCARSAPSRRSRSVPARFGQFSGSTCVCMSILSMRWISGLRAWRRLEDGAAVLAGASARGCRRSARTPAGAASRCS